MALNILTFDIEEWYIEQAFGGGRSDKYQHFDTKLKELLDALDETQMQATFFCLGELASQFPQVVKLIHSRNHHIGCHSNRHMWLSKMMPAELKEDTRLAIDSLQQCVGEAVDAYRAPAFSIGKSNSWAFEVLSENGVKIDASVFPAERDFGGFSSFAHKTPSIIQIGNATIKEMPIRTTPILGKEIAFSGGGYFRFFPYRFISGKVAQSDYTMTYFHIGDLVAEESRMMSRKEYESYFKESGTLVNRTKRYVKSNLGKKRAFDKLCRLLKAHNFVSVAQADSLIEWNTAPTIKL